MSELEKENPEAGQELPTLEDESTIPVATEAPSIESFDELKLDEKLVAAVRDMGWNSPTKIQGMCLPHTIRGRDLAGFAQTGTGKTGVFLMTIAQRILLARADGATSGKGPFAIVLSPTRELAMQIESDAQSLFKPLNISSVAVFGGIDYDKQARQLQEGIDVIVATPGRLKDYTQKKVINPAECKLFICDEADRMFDMGFIDDVEFFLDKLDEKCQKLLFSATTNDSVKELAFEYLDKPEYISAQPESITPEKIQQFAIICESVNKVKVMLSLLKRDQPHCSIIFTNTKAAAEWLQFKLNGNGLDTDLITGDLPQRKRISLIKRIKAGEVKALIATDVASRGLHIGSVTHVYNFDLPNEASNYVHRIGRTARAGATGTAVSLVCEDYGENLAAINKLLDKHPLKAEWYDAEWLKIEDKSGVAPQRKEAPRREGASSRPHQRGGRKGAPPAREAKGGPRRSPQQQAPTQATPRRPQAARPQEHRQQRAAPMPRKVERTVEIKELKLKPSFWNVMKNLWLSLLGKNR